jgi:hypothetical protein
MTARQVDRVPPSALDALNDIEATLTNAFDIGKLFEVFNSVSTILKENEKKLDTVNESISQASELIDNRATPRPAGDAKPPPARSRKKVEELMKKLEDLDTFINGNEEIEANNPKLRIQSNFIEDLSLGDLSLGELRALSARSNLSAHLSARSAPRSARPGRI